MYDLEIKDVIGRFIDEAFDYSSDDERIKDFLQGMIAALPIIKEELEWNRVDDNTPFKIDPAYDCSTKSSVGVRCLDSSIISSIEYWPKVKELLVEFKNTGKIYAYQNVPTVVFNEFMGANSKGLYFNQCIKLKYPYVDVTEKGEEIADE
jgi:hypothetical protein